MIQSSPLPSLPSSSSLHLSSISSTTTSISPSSLASSSSIDSSSSTPSTSSSPFPPPSTPPRCAGLDLLVKAIYQVTAGSVIGVPYIQKRVIRRRSKRSQNLIFDHTMFFNVGGKGKNEAVKGKGKGKGKGGVIKKQRKVKKGLNLKFEDSVVQTWRPKSRYGRDLTKLVVKV